jgi:hypothetical protein
MMATNSSSRPDSSAARSAMSSAPSGLTTAFSGLRLRDRPARLPRPRRLVAGLALISPSSTASARIRCSVLRQVLTLEAA